MSKRESKTAEALNRDAEAIGRIKRCELWAHVEFVFDGDRDVRGRLVRIARALFAATEEDRELTWGITRIEDRGPGQLYVHWTRPGPPAARISAFNEAWIEAGGSGRPAHISGL